MIRPAMAVAAATSTWAERAEYAHDARPARVGALLLDMVVFAFISFVVNNVYGVTQHPSGLSITIIGGGSYTTQVPWLVTTLVWFVYFLVPEAMFGATPGKAWMRLKVVRLDGQPLDVRSVVIRNVLRFVDSLPVLYLLGGFFVFLTPGSQRLGDIAAHTTVVYRHRAQEPGATRTSGRRARRILVGALAVAALFSIAFDYFGRPPLVIEGDFNQRLSFGDDIVSYSLGQPAWGLGTVTYPMRLRTATRACTGSISLTFSVIGWNTSQSGYECVPS